MQSTAMKIADHKHVWTAEDYRPTLTAPGQTFPGGASRLMHPKFTEDGMPALLVLFTALHAGVAHHEPSLMIAPGFILACLELQKLGWPVTIMQGPLRLEWNDDVPQDVREAWRHEFGDRGVNEIKKLLEPIHTYRRVPPTPHYASGRG